MVVQPTESMDVLGNVVDRTRSPNTSVEHRLAKATAAFWAEKTLYCDKSSSVAKWFQRYSMRIVPKVLHGCGGWSWSQSLCQKLVTWEGQNLRRILSLKRRPDEEYIPWLRRTTRYARKLFAQMGHSALTHRVLFGIHKLAGEVQFSNSDCAADAFLPADAWLERQLVVAPSTSCGEYLRLRE